MTFHNHPVISFLLLISHLQPTEWFAFYTTISLWERVHKPLTTRHVTWYDRPAGRQQLIDFTPLHVAVTPTACVLGSGSSLSQWLQQTEIGRSEGEGLTTSSCESNIHQLLASCRVQVSMVNGLTLGPRTEDWGTSIAGRRSQGHFILAAGHTYALQIHIDFWLQATHWAVI